MGVEIVREEGVPPWELRDRYNGGAGNGEAVGPGRSQPHALLIQLEKLAGQTLALRQGNPVGPANQKGGERNGRETDGMDLGERKLSRASLRLEVEPPPREREHPGARLAVREYSILR